MLILESFHKNISLTGEFFAIASSGVNIRIFRILYNNFWNNSLNDAIFGHNVRKVSK